MSPESASEMCRSMPAKSYLAEVAHADVSERFERIMLQEDTWAVARIPDFIAGLKTQTSAGVSQFTGEYFETLMWQILGGTLTGGRSEDPDLFVPDLETGECHYFQAKLSYKGNGVMIKYNQMLAHLNQEKYPDCWYALGFHDHEKPDALFRSYDNPHDFAKILKPRTIYIFPVDVIYDWYFTTAISEKSKKWYNEAHRAMREKEAQKCFYTAVSEGWCNYEYELDGIIIRSINYKIQEKNNSMR